MAKFKVGGFYSYITKTQNWVFLLLKIIEGHHYQFRCLMMRTKYRHGNDVVIGNYENYCLFDLEPNGIKSIPIETKRDAIVYIFEDPEVHLA